VSFDSVQIVFIHGSYLILFYLFLSISIIAHIFRFVKHFFKKFLVSIR
jgi:hypothetical protein